MIVQNTQGLIAAPYAPFSQKGKLNANIIGDYAAFLKERKLAGVFVNGSTGESASLNSFDRLLLMNTWVKYQDENFKVFAHVGATSIDDAKFLAKMAQKEGVFAISSTGPGYFKPSGPEALVDYLAEIAAEAPETPFYYYHIPALNHNYLPVTKVLELAIERIPNLAGMKYTYEDLMEFQLCRQLADGQLDILFGRDEILICGLTLGARGGVGSTYNFMPQVYQTIIKAFLDGNLELANQEQLRAMRVIEAYVKYQGIPAGKVIMKHMGIDVGLPRLPFKPLTASEEDALIGVLKEYSIL